MLSLELLTAVADFIELKHLRVFRLTCKGFCDASNQRFAKAYFGSVHVGRSRRSLAAFLNVTVSPNIADSIRRIYISAHRVYDGIDPSTLTESDVSSMSAEWITLIDVESRRSYHESVKRQYAEVLAEQRQLERTEEWQSAVTRGLENLNILGRPLSIGVSLSSDWALGERKHPPWAMGLSRMHTASAFRICMHSAYQSRACITRFEMQFVTNYTTPSTNVDFFYLARISSMAPETVASGLQTLVVNFDFVFEKEEALVSTPGLLTDFERLLTWATSLESLRVVKAFHTTGEVRLMNMLRSVRPLKRLSLEGLKSCAEQDWIRFIQRHESTLQVLDLTSVDFAEPATWDSVLGVLRTFPVLRHLVISRLSVRVKAPQVARIETLVLHRDFGIHDELGTLIEDLRRGTLQTDALLPACTRLEEEWREERDIWSQRPRLRQSE